MKLVKDCVITEVKAGSIWKKVNWQQLEEGDIIRFKNADGSTITDPEHAAANLKECVVKSVPHISIFPKD